MFLKPILNSKLKQYMINFGLLAAFRCFSLLTLKISALFCQLSLNMLGRQQRLILLVEKDQQVLQMC
jgi:hypothetical protein